MNWVLLVIFVSVAGENRALSTTTIPMETEKICDEAKDKLKKSYQETHAANWFLCLSAFRFAAASLDC